MKRRTALVTGAAGFLGSHVVDHLLRKNYRVISFDDLSGGFVDNVNKRSTFIKGSVCDKGLVEKIFHRYKIDYVFHLAAYAAEGLSHFIRTYNYENNLIGSMNLINESVKHNIKCFVFTSSIAVYGKNQVPMTEKLTPQPEDPYGIAKYAVELDLKAAHELFGLNYIIFRPHNVYGERQNIGDKYRNVIGIFMNRIMKGEDLIIFGDGTQKRSFSHIDDVAPIIARSIEVKAAFNRTFNVGADTPYTVNYLAKIIMKCMGKTVGIQHAPPRNEVINAYSDHTAVRKVFRIRSRPVSLVEGISRMSKSVMKVGPRRTKKFRNIELVKGLPASWL